MEFHESWLSHRNLRDIRIGLSQTISLFLCFKLVNSIDFIQFCIKYWWHEHTIGFWKQGCETLGGFIINHTENIPEQDELLSIENFQIKILKVSSSKIDAVSFKIDTQQISI